MFLGQGSSGNVPEGTLLRISQTGTPPQAIAIANLDPSAENVSSGGLIKYGVTLRRGIDMRVTKEKFLPPESK